MIKGRESFPPFESAACCFVSFTAMRAEPPRAKARTCSAVAIVVSPVKVVRSAPCAQPSLRLRGRLAREQP